MKKIIIIIGILTLLAPMLVVSCVPQNSVIETTQAPIPSILTATSTIPLSADTPTPANPVITIAYSPTFVMQAEVGHILILNIAIHNTGYESFDTSPEYFSAVVANKPYKYSVSLSDLRAVSLPDGGKIIGKLAFPVPAGTASNRVGFTMDYSGTKLYNIQWFQRD